MVLKRTLEYSVLFSVGINGISTQGILVIPLTPNLTSRFDTKVHSAKNAHLSDLRLDILLG